MIDFVDMEDKHHRNAVLRKLLDAMKSDKARTKVLHFSSIGLVEMTRQRVRRSLESVSYQSCPYCGGRGIVKSPLTVSIEIIREAEARLRSVKYKKLEIRLHPCLKEYLLANYKDRVNRLGKRYRSGIDIVEDHALHIEDYRMKLK